MHEKYIKPLKCKKWLVLGNHDHKSNHWYLNNGWDWVGRQFKWKYGGKYILFSHIPQPDDRWFDINIHGHFHNSDHRKRELELVAIYTNKHYLLAIENINYQPVLLTTILSKRQFNQSVNRSCMKRLQLYIKRISCACK